MHQYFDLPTPLYFFKVEKNMIRPVACNVRKKKKQLISRKVEHMS
jgi:hypothetical protein